MNVHLYTNQLQQTSKHENSTSTDPPSKVHGATEWQQIKKTPTLKLPADKQTHEETLQPTTPLR